MFEGFDPAQWAAELDGFQPGDETLRSTYEQDKERRFRVDPAEHRIIGPPALYQPFEVPAVRAEVLRIASAEEVMNQLLRRLRDKQGEALQGPSETRRVAKDANIAAQEALTQARKDLAATPDSQELKDLVARREAEQQQSQQALDAAERALQAARDGWNFGAAFLEATAGKTGCRVVDVPGPGNAEELEQLPGLGKWSSPWLAVGVAAAGDLGSSVSRTEQAAIAFRVTELEPRPLKRFDKIVDRVRDLWWTHQAKQLSETRRKTLEAALLRLAKERIPEKVAQVEARRAGQIEEKMAAWEQGVQTRLQKAQSMVQSERPGTRAHQTWQRELAAQQAELDQKEAKRVEIAEAVAKELEDELKVEARKEYGAVLEAAAAEAGFTVSTYGPLRRDVTADVVEPRWKYGKDETRKFVFQPGRASGLKEGESTDLMADETNRRWHLCVCLRVEPLTAADLTRKEFEVHRRYGGRSFLESRVTDAVAQSFTLDALKTRYRWRQNRPESVVVPAQPK
jgi:hypothetical protein